MFWVILIIVVFIVLYLAKYYAYIKNYPKGPMPIPLLGNLHQLKTHNTHLHFDELAKAYGDVFTVFMPRPVVIITKFQNMKKALIRRGDDFVGRSGLFPDNIFQSFPNGGITFASGDSWREQRRISLRILKDFGMGSGITEDQTNFGTEDQSKKYRLRCGSADGSVVSSSIKESQQLKDDADKLKVFIREQVDKQKAQFDPCKEPQTFVHALLLEMHKGNRFLCYEQLVDITMDFWLAAMETTSITLRWAILFLIANPQVQHRMRAEIIDIVGKDRRICMADKLSMPYCTVAVVEIQRRANVLPQNVMHRTVKQTMVSGHCIPADTLVLPQISSVLSDSSLFENPDEFKPERFLQDDGKTPHKELLQYVVPFSMGKRQCAGEPLASVKLFLILTTLLQNFILEKPLDGALPDLEPDFAFFAFPKQYKLRIVPISGCEES
ncbi:Cytochrome P450 2H1 [Toxocara canis]|uniref:Cytochrome P450 2H1 n=1 Tax=Toxocara canis TaxID=6265 RepID=A0A0B2VEB1_TOXCA|nr:Cytochrome P450 2H1 [Toxocara canis]